MSIDKFVDWYTLSCDNCGKELDDVFDDFYDAVNAKKDNGWKSKKRHGNWEDWCHECCEN